MKRIAAAVSFLASIAAAQAEEPFAKERLVWNQPTPPFRIIGNVYYVGTAELSVYLIVTPKGLILIEAALPESVPQIEKNIEMLGFKPRDVKLVLSGHAHFDHFGGLAGLKKDTGAEVVAMAEDKPFLEAGRISFGPSMNVQMPPVKVDRVVHDGETVSLGDATLTANLTPGHTPGCTTWTMPVVQPGATYQVVFACSTSVAGNPLVGNTAYPTIAADYRRSFEKFRGMHADVFLTEHAKLCDMFGKAARAEAGIPRAFVDPGEMGRFEQASERDFNEQLAKAAHSGK